MSDSVEDLTFDARPDRIDVRDRIYMPPLRSLPSEWPKQTELAEYFPDYANKGLILNQGREGACTGFGLACVANYLFWRNAIHENGGNAPSAQNSSKVSPRMLYHLARYYDEWPGEDYEGSSCRGAIKAWYKHGVCSETKWPYRNSDNEIQFVSPSDGWREDAVSRPLGVYYRIEKQSLVDMQAAIHEVGAIYVSANVHKGWELRNAGTPKDIAHNNIHTIQWNGEQKKLGGHAFAIVGYNSQGFIVQNSWSDTWGTHGFAILTYDDWLVHGTDAWVCVLGAPVNVKSSPIHVVQAEGAGLSSQSGFSNAGRAQWLFDFVKQKQTPEFAFGQGPVAPWSDETAYQHTVVMGNNGRVIQKIVTNENSSKEIEHHTVNLPLTWHKNQGNGNVLKVVLYAHGGLNKEEESLQRIKILAPYFKANGVYPLFLTWKTGVGDTIKGILYDQLEKGLSSFKSEYSQSGVGFSEVINVMKASANETVDRTLEVICESLGPKTLWSQMKQNAKAACENVEQDPRGGVLVANALATLNETLAKQNKTLELHLIGHSAGSIIAGHLLQLLQQRKLKISSCSLYAAACTVEFANATFVNAIKNETFSANDFHLYNLSEARERDDSVGPYNKSLLYLVSRALEDWHKTPLLGLDASIQRQASEHNLWAAPTAIHVAKWQKFFNSQKPHYYVTDDVKSPTVVKWQDATQYEILDTVNADHGSFDNDINVLMSTLTIITGQAQIKYPIVNLTKY